MNTVNHESQSLIVQNNKTQINVENSDDSPAAISNGRGLSKGSSNATIGRGASKDGRGVSSGRSINLGSIISN